MPEGIKSSMISLACLPKLNSSLIDLVGRRKFLIFVTGKVSVVYAHKDGKSVHPQLHTRVYISVQQLGVSAAV